MNLVWIDMEMTGLDLSEQIMEIAVIVTDPDLNIIEVGPDLVVHADEDKLQGMCKWCQKQHGKSGLTEESRNSKITVEEAEKEILKFIKKHCSSKEAPVCGNSVWCDKKFIDKYMPKLSEYLHYRIIDVSSIKELAVRWYPSLKHERKEENHRAMDDIKESINELKFYRESIFK